MSERRPIDPEASTSPVETEAAPPSKLEVFFRPVVEDEGLRPVVAAVFIGLWAMLGWGLLLAVRDLHPAAILSVLALGALTVETLVRGHRERGRIGVAGWCLVVLWLGAAAFAAGGFYTGYL